MFVSYENRPGTKFADKGDGYHVEIDVKKRNGTTERRWVGTIGHASDGARIYQFRGQRLATMSFVYYGIRCLSLGTAEWQTVSRMADRIEFIDIELGLVWVITVDNAARHGQLRPTRNGARYLINLGAFHCYDKDWNMVRKAKV